MKSTHTTTPQNIATVALFTRVMCSVHINT